MNKKYLPIVILVFAFIIGFIISFFLQSSMVDVGLENVKVRYMRQNAREGNVHYGAVGTLEVTLNISNPDNEPVVIKEIEYKIYCNNDYVSLKNYYKQKVEIAPKSYKVFSIPYEFKFGVLEDPDMLYNPQSWKIEGTLHINEPKEVEVSFKDILEVK